MIQEISDKKIDWLVSSLINNDLLMKEDPIIAGGFALSVYRAYRLYDTDYKWGQLERSLIYDDSGSSTALMIDDFGDIDMWFTAGSGVHNYGQSSWMIRESEETELIEAPLDGYRRVGSSVWANSYRRKANSYNLLKNNSDYITQIIKSPASDIDSLFRTFDFINSCVAYHKGVLYYHQSLDKFFERFELSVNNPTNYRAGSMPQKVYSALRAFKYAKRFSLDFSEELSGFIYNIYSELDNMDFSHSENPEQRVYMQNNVYGNVFLSKNDFLDMKKSLKSNFSMFTKMKTFKDEYAMFLLDKKSLSGLKEYINR